MPDPAVRGDHESRRRRPSRAKPHPGWRAPGPPRRPGPGVLAASVMRSAGVRRADRWPGRSDGRRRRPAAHRRTRRRPGRPRRSRGDELVPDADRRLDADPERAHGPRHSHVVRHVADVPRGRDALGRSSRSSASSSGSGCGLRGDLVAAEDPHRQQVRRSRIAPAGPRRRRGDRPSRGPSRSLRRTGAGGTPGLRVAGRQCPSRGTGPANARPPPRANPAGSRGAGTSSASRGRTPRGSARRRTAGRTPRAPAGWRRDRGQRVDERAVPVEDDGVHGRS